MLQDALSPEETYKNFKEKSTKIINFLVQASKEMYQNESQKINTQAD